MPGYRAHLLGGCVAFLTVFFVGAASCAATLQDAIIACVFCLAGSLFPDIDVKSKGQKYFYWVVLIMICAVSFYGRFDALMVISVLSLTPMLVKHRGLFHEPWFLIAFPLGIWALLKTLVPLRAESFFCFVIFFIAGSLSHLLLDRDIRGIFYSTKKRFRKRW